jgi:RND family efflux transporter MFP subunit
MRLRRRTVAIVVAVALLAVIAALVLRPKNAALAVRTETVAYREFRVTLPETGVVQRPQTQALPALVSGNLASLLVRPGDRVVAGQVVATLENPQLVSTLAADRAAAAAAAARAQSAAATNAVIPAQNRSSVVQAQANLQQARATLVQARQDLASGQQSGLGYSGQSAEDQRLQADAAVSKADTDLREARRIATADRDLYAQKAISKDALDQAQARLDQASVTADQAHRERTIIEGQLGRQRQTLGDRLRASEDAVRQAQAALDAARATASQNKSSDVAAARDDAARANEQAGYDRDSVDRLQIRAPFDGVVQTVAEEPGDSYRTLQPGDPVAAGQALVTVAKGDRFVVRAKIDEQDVNAVTTGQKVRVSGEDFAGKSLAGRVAHVGAVAQKSDDPSNTSRQVLATIALDDTLPFLRDGMSVDVDITTHRVAHVLVIPNDAIRREGKRKPYVFVVRDGVARRTDVTLGSASDTQTIVRRGLAAGTRIVVDRNPALRDGSRVR